VLLPGYNQHLKRALGLLGLLSLSLALALALTLGSRGACSSACGSTCGGTSGALCSGHQVGKSSTVDSLGGSVGCRFSASLLVGGERLCAGWGRVNNHDHTNLAMLGLGAVDGNRLSACNGDCEAWESASADENAVFAANSKLVTSLLASFLASSGTLSGGSSCSSCSSSSWSGNEAGVEFVAWGTTDAGVSRGDGVVLLKLESTVQGEQSKHVPE
jgi:hypothetical protein